MFVYSAPYPKDGKGKVILIESYELVVFSCREFPHLCEDLRVSSVLNADTDPVMGLVFTFHACCDELAGSLEVGLP